MSYDAYNSALNVYKTELEQFEKKRKREIILDLAKMLEVAGYPTEMISQKLSDDLQGYISSRHIREVLEELYKSSSKVRQSAANDDKKVIEETEKKKQIMVTNAGNVATQQDETLEDDEDDVPPVPNKTQDNEIVAQLKARVAELEEIELKRVASDFKPAAAISAAEPENKTNELFLSMDHWSTMFMIMRNGEKKGFWCKHNGKEIVNIEANYVRAKAQAQQQKVKAK